MAIGYVDYPAGYVQYLFESAIDLLSYYDLYGKKAGNYLSVSGVYQPNKKGASFTIPAAVSYFLLHNPNTKKIHICFDNDDAGLRAFSQLAQALETTDVSISEMSGLYEGYKDLIEMLVKTKTHFNT